MNKADQKAVTIRSADGVSQAEFSSTHGGIGRSLVLPIDGRPTELLYVRETFWDVDEDTGGLPFLFPVCGRHFLHGDKNRYQWGDHTLTMPLHGFAMRRKWQISDMCSNSIVMRLEYDDETLALYPFYFTVELEYTLSTHQLTCKQRYFNQGSEPMPIYAGFHPYFILNNPDGTAWTIGGDMKEKGTYGPSFTAIAQWQCVEPKTDALTAAAAQHVFSLPTAWQINLKRNGRTQFKLSSQPASHEIPFKYLQTFRSGTDPFICLEPWMALPNGLNDPDRIPMVMPGQTAYSHWNIRSGDLPEECARSTP